MGHLTRLQSLWRLTLLGVASSGLLMCDGSYAMDKAEPCRNAGYAIASRVHACTGDTERANQLYNRFAEELYCSIDEPVATDFRCAYHINSYDCARVATNGDAFDAWLATEGCATILSYANGDPVPSGGGSDAGASDPFVSDPECAGALTALAELVLACNQNPRNQSAGQVVDEQLASLEQTHECDESAGASELATCSAALDARICLELPSHDFKDLLALAPACAAVIPAKTPADAGADQ